MYDERKDSAELEQLQHQLGSYFFPIIHGEFQEIHETYHGEIYPKACEMKPILYSN